MIFTRSPLRISLGGGGTDLPSYYREHGGALIAASIDKYVYINIHERFSNDFVLKYSRVEHCEAVDQIEHPIIRECLRLVDVRQTNLEITSMADIPSGTGLGSSGSFTTALLRGLHTLKKNLVHPLELAEQACAIEIDRLGEPVGKQDQYIAACGGLTCFRFERDGTVQAIPLNISADLIDELEDNLLLFFTGYSRSASSILREQDDKSRQADTAMTENLHFIKDLGEQTKVALEAGDFRTFAELMNVHWRRKKERSAGMSNGQIDRWLALGLECGALGGKLIGAGGGGFLLFYAEDKIRLREAMRKEGLREVRFHFDFEGTKII